MVVATSLEQFLVTTEKQSHKPKLLNVHYGTTSFIIFVTAKGSKYLQIRARFELGLLSFQCSSTHSTIASTRTGSELKLKCTKYFRDNLTLVIQEQLPVSYKKAPSIKF